MHNVSIIAQVKYKKTNPQKGTIIIRAFMNRMPVASKSTGLKIEKENWDMKYHKVKPGATNAVLINGVIEKHIHEIETVLLKKMIMGATINKSHLVEAIGGNDSGADFISWCKKRIKLDYDNPGTVRMKTAQITKLASYSKKVSFGDIDYNFIQGYKIHMRDVLKNKDNTIWSSLKAIKTMVRKAVKEGGLILTNPFDNFDIGTYADTGKPHLSLNECQLIEKYIQDPDGNSILKKVAAKFLLMVYSGMRFSDAMTFDPDLHTKDGRFIRDYQKFDGKVDFKIYNRLAYAIELQKQYPCNYKNQPFNRSLKLLAIECKINFNLSSHCGRHTLGFMLANKNVPIEKSQKILGHRKLESTKGYYHIDRDQVDREVLKLDEI